MKNVTIEQMWKAIQMIKYKKDQKAKEDKEKVNNEKPNL